MCFSFISCDSALLKQSTVCQSQHWHAERLNYSARGFCQANTIRLDGWFLFLGSRHEESLKSNIFPLSCKFSCWCVKWEFFCCSLQISRVAADDWHFDLANIFVLDKMEYKCVPHAGSHAVSFFTQRKHSQIFLISNFESSYVFFFFLSFYAQTHSQVSEFSSPSKSGGWNQIVILIWLICHPSTDSHSIRISLRIVW